MYITHHPLLKTRTNQPRLLQLHGLKNSIDRTRSPCDKVADYNQERKTLAVAGTPRMHFHRAVSCDILKEQKKRKTENKHTLSF